MDLQDLRAPEKGARPRPQPGAPSRDARATGTAHAPSGRRPARREPSPPRCPRAAARSAPGGAARSCVRRPRLRRSCPGRSGEGDALTMSGAAPPLPSWLKAQGLNFALLRLAAVQARLRALANQRPAHGSAVLDQPMGTRARAAPQSVAAILWQAGRMMARSRSVRGDSLRVHRRCWGGAWAGGGYLGRHIPPLPGCSELGGCLGLLLPLPRCTGGGVACHWRAGAQCEGWGAHEGDYVHQLPFSPGRSVSLAHFTWAEQQNLFHWRAGFPVC